MYLNRMILLIGLCVFLAPPLVVQLSEHIRYGWLIPALGWLLVNILVWHSVKHQDRQHD